jgi:hypothetical protein
MEQEHRRAHATYRRTRQVGRVRGHGLSMARAGPAVTHSDDDGDNRYRGHNRSDE